MAHIIARYILESRGAGLTDRTTFERVVRGKDGTGYSYLTDEEISKVYLCYLMDTAEGGDING